MSKMMRPVIEQWGPSENVPQIHDEGAGEWAAGVLRDVVPVLVPGTSVEVYEYGDMVVACCDNGEDVCKALALYGDDYYLNDPEFLAAVGWDEVSDEAVELLFNCRLMAPIWATHLDQGALRLYIDA